MSGTSLDGLDMVAVRLHGHGLSPDLRADVLAAVSLPLGSLGEHLRDLAESRPFTAADIASLHRRFADLHADAAEALTAKLGQRPDLLAIHGQTVYHSPPHSWQLADPTPLARRLACPVVFNLRAADIAAGGQGAPITPLADWVLFRNATAAPAHARPAIAVVNLGGFANFTLLPAARSTPAEEWAAISAGDICACNHILDTIARRVLGVPYDTDGAAAAQGEVDEEALDDLRGILTAQTRPGRSLGTGDEAMSWVGRHRTRLEGPHLAATACEAIAETIAAALLQHTQAAELPALTILAGGGARNQTLQRALAAAACSRVLRSDALPAELGGMAPEHREGAAIAVLGALCQDRVPITLPQVTGCPASQPPVGGTWVYPPAP